MFSAIKIYQSQQSEEQGRRSLPVEQGRTRLPVEQGRTRLPVEQGRTSLPVEQGRTRLPVEQGRFFEMSNEWLQRDSNPQPLSL